MDSTVCEETIERKKEHGRGKGKINPSCNQKFSMVELKNILPIACTKDSDVSNGDHFVFEWWVQSKQSFLFNNILGD